MKKTRVIIAAAMVTTMLVGAGFAAWTDKLTVTNTVSTGELKVQFMNENNYPNIKNYYYTKDTAGVWNCNPDKNTYITATAPFQSDKALTVNVANMYPGSLVSYEAEMKNNGTIPAVIDTIDVTYNLRPEGVPKNVTGWNTDAFKAGLSVYGGITYHKQVAPGKYDIDNSKKIWFYSNLANFATDFNKALKATPIRVEPNDYITFDIPQENKADIAKLMKVGSINNDENCINFWLSPETKDLQNEGASFNIIVNFKQHNM